MSIIKSLVSTSLKDYFYKIIDRLVLGKKRKNYREALFEELITYSKNEHYYKILEIGPKDGLDTKRLSNFNPEELCLIDLANKEEGNKVWLKELHSEVLKYFTGNIMYDKVFKEEYFDLIWCTGVLYHNPEQLRMVRLLYDLLKPKGVLVIESATIKEGGSLRKRNVIQINYPPSDAYKKKYHISHNITHLPSRRAVWSWLSMVGFEDIQRSRCHGSQSIALSKTRVAYIARKPEEVKKGVGTYYTSTHSPYEIGKSL